MDIFYHDERLGILVPHLEKEWDEYNMKDRQEILVKWEKIRGRIPDRIKELEKSINQKQEQLNTEDDFEQSCILNSDISELASMINDLWIWYRTNQNITSKVHM